LQLDVKNPEDKKGIVVDYVKSSDNKLFITQPKGYTYNIEAVSGQTGNAQYKVGVRSLTEGLEEIVLNAEITPSVKHKINYKDRPNVNTGMGKNNFYGSGDADNDGLTLNGNDLTRLTEVANGTYTNPNDKRLRDRCDVNGDGNVNLQDKQTLQDRLNGVIPYMPSEWDKLPTRAQKEDWAKKMLAIDNTNTTAFPGGDCNQFKDQLGYINFYGVSATDIPKFQEVYPYNFTNNGRFNLPLLEVITIENDINGKLISGHAMNAFIFDNNFSNFANVCPVEPQSDHINVKFGEDYLIGINSKFYIRGLPITGIYQYPDGKKAITGTGYIDYNTKDKIPTLTWSNPDLTTP
jgi:hypothetical protein